MRRIYRMSPRCNNGRLATPRHEPRSLQIDLPNSRQSGQLQHRELANGATSLEWAASYPVDLDQRTLRTPNPIPGGRTRIFGGETALAQTARRGLKVALTRKQMDEPSFQGETYGGFDR
jgi:hypothetical protein